MSQHGSRRNLLDNQQTVNQKNKTMCKQLKKNFETTVRAERHRIPKILQQQVSQTCVKHGIHGLDGVQTEPGRETESVETNGRENWWPEGGTWTRAQVTNYCNGGVWGYFWWWSFRHWYIGGLLFSWWAVCLYQTHWKRLRHQHPSGDCFGPDNSAS